MRRVGGDGAAAVASVGTPAASLVAVGVLVAAGQGTLAPPPLADLAGWADERGPVVAAVALLRLAALGGAAWLASVTAVAAVAERLGATRVVDAAHRSLPPVLRRVLTGLAGAGAAGAVVVGAAGGASPGAASGPPAVERLVRLPDAPPDPPPVETMVVLDEAAPSSAPPPPPPPPPPATRGAWVVQPGDSFWSITEELLADALGRAPTDAEVDPAWRRLIDANRDRLVSADPDLLLPGQELVVPGA